MKNLKLLTLFYIIAISMSSCQNNDTEEEITQDPSSSIAKNSIQTTGNSGTFNYYTFNSYALANGTVFDFTITENQPTSIQNPNYGSYIRIFIKNLPTQNTTFTHRPDPNFNLEDGQYYLTNARIGNSSNQEWYGPYINSRTTAELKVNIENGIATFTIIDAELSDNFVAPITTTEIFSLSFSINLSELTGSSVNSFTALAS